MVTFTGSTAVGRKILAAAAPTVKKTVMELGGKSTHIVLDDADLAEVLPLAAGGVCTMSGQGCTLATRILLPRSMMAEGLAIMRATMERFPYGDPWDMKNYSGPSISDTQRAKVIGLIEGAVAAGATLITGGGRPAHLPTGYYIEPTLLSDVDPRSAIGQEETFGPVVTVTPYDTEEEAVAIANDTIYGLAGQVSSGDDDHALAVALKINTGTIGANVGGVPPTIASLYNNPALFADYPFHADILKELEDASVRPKTPVYQVVSIDISHLISPASGISPTGTEQAMIAQMNNALQSKGLVP